MFFERVRFDKISKTTRRDIHHLHDSLETRDGNITRANIVKLSRGECSLPFQTAFKDDSGWSSSVVTPQNSHAICIQPDHYLTVPRSSRHRKKQRRTREDTTVDRSVCKCEREYLYTTLDFCGRGRVVALVLFRSTRTNETFCSRGRIFAEWKRCPFIPFFLFQAGWKVPDEKKRKFGRRCLIVIIKFQHNGEREGVVMKFPPTLFSHQQNKYFPSY